MDVLKLIKKTAYAKVAIEIQDDEQEKKCREFFNHVGLPLPERDEYACDKTTGEPIYPIYYSLNTEDIVWDWDVDKEVISEDGCVFVNFNDYMEYLYRCPGLAGLFLLNVK